MIEAENMTGKSNKTKKSKSEPKDIAVLRKKAEKKLRQQTDMLDELTEKDVRQLVHELGTYQIELEMQNEELRRAQNELEASRSKYSDLYDFAPVGYFTFDKNGLIIETNLTGATILGVDRNNLINRPFPLFINKDDRNVFRVHCSEVLKNQTIQECEIRLRRKGSAGFYAQLQSIPVKDSDGNAVYCRTALSDISKRKEIEEALRSSFERYRSYIEVTGQLGWVTNADGEVVEDLPSWRKYTGQTYEEIKGWGWSKALHPEDLQHTTLAWKNAVTANSAYEVEYRIRRHDGIYRHFLTRGVPMHKEDGSIREWVGTCIDITEIKQKEEKIRHLASFPQLNPSPVVEVNSSGKVTFFNPATERILESLEIDKEDVRAFLPHDMESILRDWNQENESALYREMIIKDRMFGANIYLFPKFKVARIYAYDITERKRTEEELLRSREDMDRAQEVGSIGSWRLDVKKNVLTWSDENYRMFGIPKGTELTYETFLSTVHPDDRAYVDTRWKAGLQCEPYDIEHRIVVDGQVIWVREVAHLEFDKDGTLLGGFGISQDITSRKQAEEKLRTLNENLEQRVEQRTRFFAVLAEINEAIVRKRDRQALFDEVCRIIIETGGFKLAWIGLLDPESREVRPVAGYGATGYIEGIRIIAANVPEGKGPTGRAIVEGRNVINMDFEMDENMLPWRERARQYGLRSSSALPLSNGPTVIGVLTIYSGQRGFFATEEVSLLRALAEDISFALETITDREEKMLAENELRCLMEELRELTAYLQEMRETERTAIAREIHDELGQIITALRIDLVWIKNTYGDHEALFNKSNAMLALVDSTIQSIQNIIASLRPSILDVLGIYAAIEWQTEELKKMTGISCNLTLPSEEVPINEKVSVNIFRIVQELFTNIARYAKATNVSLSLDRVDDDLVLNVSDNGVGIRPHEISNPTSFGIIGIRERVLSLDGDIKITGRPGFGTSIRITIPVQNAG